MVLAPMLVAWIVVVALQLAGPSCEVGDTSVAAYLALDSERQVALVDQYRRRFRTALEEADEALRLVTQGTPFLVEWQKMRVSEARGPR